MEKHIFCFSVVSAVYNVEAFLPEAVESLVHQTIGFSRIQLILVDDGSTDKSGAICDAYRKKYPENVVVIHKENGRQASARNAGIPYIKGKYVSYMDPDDTLEPDAMEKVQAFLDRHKETDICCIPMFFFGNQTGPHMLNDKFAEGSRVVDLTEEENADCLLLSAASAFYRADTARKMHFDTELYQAEDAKENLRLFMERPFLGLVADTKYNYRKHGNSTIDRTLFHASSYTSHLKRFSCWALDEAEKRFGRIPAFVQHAVMYDLQWRLRISRIPDGVLTGSEEKEYKDLLLDTIYRIDDEVIKKQKMLYPEHFSYVFSRKYGCMPELCAAEAEDGHPDIELRFGESSAGAVSRMKTVLEFLNFDLEKKCFVLEGYHILCGLEAHEKAPFILAGGKRLPCESVDRSSKEKWFLGDRLTETLGFRAEIPERLFRGIIVPGLVIDGTPVGRRLFGYGQFFPLSGRYQNACAFLKNRMVTVRKEGLCVTAKPGILRASVRECRLLAEIWRKNHLGGRKAVGGRLYYHFMMLFKRKKLWIVSDRIMKADDNGEALFRYLRKSLPENTKVVFAISKNSPDWGRMKKIGPCVDAMSFRHKLLHLLCDVNISAQADNVTVNPFDGHADALRDLLTHQHFVFLQHGVIKDDLSAWANRYNKDASGFVTSAEREWESIVNGAYSYPADKIWLAGLPRFDRLYHDEKKIITVMPTWRRYLLGKLDSRTGKWTVREDFRETDYFRFYNGLLNSERLLSFLAAKGYQLHFFPHPNMQPVLDEFRHDRRVLFLPEDTSYRDVYARSSLVMTDYSSAVFDFAYLRKPVVYCHFDREQFFAGEHSYSKGYFEYERDGFGEIVYDLEPLIDLIVQYVREDCCLKELYRKRIDGFFAFHDKNSCRRVTEKILALPEKS